MERSQWVIEGDRSHPDLIKLDSLRLSYPGWQNDFLAAERAHVTGTDYDAKLFKLEESQRMHTGDRSHSRLVKLDSLKLCYPGCEEDIRDAERHYHLVHGNEAYSNLLFESILEGLKNRQRMFLGDRSHPQLKKLDKLKLSYPGWKEDFEAAESEHRKGFTYTADDRLHTLKEKQRLYEGCRSHWRLKKLDSLKLSYPGWQEDAKEVETYHVENRDGEFSNVLFKRKLQGLKNRQDMFMGNRSHPNLKKLDKLSLTYPGWQEDVAAAMIAHGKGVGYDEKLHKIKEKQRLYAGDRSHSRVVEIDSLDLSYPGWQDDVRELEQYHLNYEGGPILNICFQRKIEGIRNKQTMYMGYCNEQQDNSEEHANVTENDSTEDNEKIDLGLCIACMARPKSCAFVPCGHVSLCETCSTKSMFKTGRCPICRQRVEKSVKLFIC